MIFQNMFLTKLDIEKKISCSLKVKSDLVVTRKRPIGAKKFFISLNIKLHGEFFLSLKLSNYFAQLEEKSFLNR